MNKTVHINFNQKSISDLISKLEIINNDMKSYPDKLVKEIAYDALTHLDMLYASTPYQLNVGNIDTRVKKIANGSTLSWTDTSVKDNNGKVYYYRVKAYNATKESSTFTNKKIARIKGVALSSAKNSATKKITVKWKKNAKSKTNHKIRCR